MNIIPLIPLGAMKDYERPDCAMMEKVRDEVEEILSQPNDCIEYFCVNSSGVGLLGRSVVAGCKSENSNCNGEKFK